MFLSFIRLADYLIVGTLHVLAVNSVQSLFNYFTEQLENTPTLAEIQGNISTNPIEEKLITDTVLLKKETGKKTLMKGTQILAQVIFDEEPFDIFLILLR